MDQPQDCCLTCRMYIYSPTQPELLYASVAPSLHQLGRVAFGKQPSNSVQLNTMLKALPRQSKSRSSSSWDTFTAPAQVGWLSYAVPMLQSSPGFVKISGQKGARIIFGDNQQLECQCKQQKVKLSLISQETWDAATCSKTSSF